MPLFRKRRFTATTLLTATFSMLRYSPWLVWAYLFRGIERGRAERILLLISAVNDCRYCCWFHSYMAMRSEISAEEVTRLLQQMIPSAVGVAEQAALLFAIRYADEEGRLTAQALEPLAAHYDSRHMKGILALCAAIRFGNLCGNTFDAFLHRLRGQPVEQGSLFVEAIVFLLSAPFLLPLLPWMRARGV